MSKGWLAKEMDLALQDLSTARRNPTRCMRCGRPIYAPESQRTGLGEKCRRRTLAEGRDVSEFNPAQMALSLPDPPLQIRFEGSCDNIITDMQTAGPSRFTEIQEDEK